MISECGYNLREIAMLNEDRAAFYRLLASLFWKELTDDQLDRLKLVRAEEVCADDACMDAGWLDIELYLDGLNSGTRQELAVDYAHTFLAAGNNNDKMAIPFESVFMSEAGLLMQEPRDEVCKMFLAERISPSNDLHTPEDHIAFELEFLAVMAHRQTLALEQADLTEAKRCAEVQARFIHEHILNWVDVFCDAIEANCRTQFYRGVANVLRGWVKFDAECIAVMERDVHSLCFAKAH